MAHSISFAQTLLFKDMTAEDWSAAVAIDDGSGPTNWAEVLADAQVEDAGQKTAAIAALSAFEQTPSLASATGLLAHFETFARNGAFLNAAIAANPRIFRLADAVKYDLVAQTSAKMHADSNNGIAAVVRVGSSGDRFRTWLEWAKSSPRGPLPVDAKYELEKLFRSDDDVTHWATPTALARSSLANEVLNSSSAAGVFASITQDILQSYPEEFRKAALKHAGGNIEAVDPTWMMVEFLSPTQAQEIMASPSRRTQRGWPLRKELFEKTHFLGAWILAEKEKYNGLFASEQLHSWGLDKGMATENPADPLNSTISYAQSAQSGVLADLVGNLEFPDGNRDPFGWMANNYRQIFVTHEKETSKGDVEPIAKYTLRMEDWWSKVGLHFGESVALTRDIQTPDFDIELELQPLQLIMNAIRRPHTEADRQQMIEKYAVDEATAFKKLKDYNLQMLIAGHRKHFNVLANSLTEALVDHNRDNPPKQGVPPTTLTLDEIWSRAESEKAAAQSVEDGRSKDDPRKAAINIFNFRQSLEAMANGYANLPDDVVRILAKDLATFVARDLESPDADPVRAQIRTAILPTLQESVRQARASGADLKAQAAAFETLTAIKESPLGKSLEHELERLKQPDLDNYLLKIVRGDLTIRRLAFVPGDEESWPSIRFVDDQRTPRMIADDIERLEKLSKAIGWSNQDYVGRLAAYVTGPKSANGITDPGFPDRAINLYLELGNLFRGEPRAVSYQTIDGDTRTLRLEPTRFADPALTMGHFLFSETLKGGEVGLKLWGIKGDVEAASGLYDAMAGIVSPDRESSPQKRAAALASLVANSLSLTSYVEMGLGRAGYTDAAAAFGETSLLGKASNTFGTAAQYANDPVSRDAPGAFTQAVLQDLLIYAQPKVAVALALHSIYQFGATKYTDIYTRSELIDLFVRNGRWSFPDDGKKPVLDALYSNGRWIEDDAAGRVKQCRARLIAERGIGGSQSFSPIGVEKIFRIPEAVDAAGIRFCTGPLGTGCPAADADHVKPREALLSLYATAGYTAKDPLMTASQDAVNDLLGWVDAWNWIPQMLRGTSIDGISKTDLENHGIFVPTPEDATQFTREKINVDTSPRRLATTGSGIGAGLTLEPTSIQARLTVGARKLYGYLVSQTWVRRQHILDCSMLDPLIAAAGRKAQEERIKTLEPTDFLAEFEDLEARIKAIDDEFWPKIAASADPYVSDWPASEDKAALRSDYRKLTLDLRQALEAMDRWSKAPDSGPFPEWALPPPPQERVLIPLPASDDQPDIERLTKGGREHLASALHAVITYEDAFAAVGKTLASVAQLAKTADGLDILPIYFHALQPDSEQLFLGVGSASISGASPATSGEQAPSAIAFAARVISHKTLENLKKEEKDWNRIYTDARNAALSDMTEKMAVFQARLQPVWLDFMSPSQAVNNPLSGIAAEDPGDLALRHPLWKKVLRLSLQSARLELAERDIERMDETEYQTLLKSIALYPPDQTQADAPQGADYPARIASLKTLVDDRYQKMLSLVENMFELKIDKGSDSWVLLDEPVVRVDSNPHQISELTQDDVDTLAHKHIFEIVPASDELIGQVNALSAYSPEADASIPRMVAATDQLSPSDQKLTDALAVCASRPERDGGGYFSSTFRVVENGDKGTLMLPLTRSGRFLLRVTVLNKTGVPMAQAMGLVLVEPGELIGYVRFEGDVASDQFVRLAFGEPDRRQIAQYVDVNGVGLFKSPLCEFVVSEVIDESSPTPRLLSRDTMDGRFVARAIGIAGIARPLIGDPVSALYRGSGGFFLEDELVLSDSGQISVNAEVRDHSGAPLPGAEVTLHAGSVSDVAVSEGHYTLNAGDIVYASARMVIGERTFEARSESVSFDPVNDSGGLSFVVKLPVYDTGNLTVTGHFAPNAAAKNLGGIARGEIYTNFVRGPPVVVSGNDFVFSNDRPIAVEDGLTMTALLSAADDLASYIHIVPPSANSGVASDKPGEMRKALKEGRVLALGNVTVAPFSTRSVDLPISVIDWTGAPVPTDLLAVTLDDHTATRLAGGFRFSGLSFKGARQKVTAKAAYTGAGGRIFEADEELSVNLIGDPWNASPPAPLILRVPVYLPSSLQLSGLLVLDTEDGNPEGTPADVVVQADSSQNSDPWNEFIARRFTVKLLRDIAPGEGVTLTGQSRFKTHEYTGRRSLKAPQVGRDNGPALIDIGDVILRQPGVLPTATTEPDDDDPPPPDPPIEVQVPSLANLLPGVARGVLAASELEMLAVPLESPTPPGRAPGISHQNPVAGTMVSKGAVVTVYHYPNPPDPTSEPEPEPEPEPDVADTSPDEPKPDLEPEPVDNPQQEEPGDFDPIGGWLGTAKVTDIRFNVKEFKLECNSFNSCQKLWHQIVFGLQKARIAKQKEQMEKDKDKTLGDVLAEAFTAFASDDDDNSMVIGLAPLALVGFDLAFHGIPFGFEILGSETDMQFGLPGSSTEAAALLAAIRIQRQVSGDISFSHQIAEDGATAEITGTLAANVDNIERMDLTLLLEINQLDWGTGRIELEATLGAGNPDVTDLWTELKNDYGASLGDSNNRIGAMVEKMIADLKAMEEE